MKVIYNLKNQNLKYYILLTIFSFFLMLIFSKSSPLYFINDWVDANAFFSVGKAIAHGQTPYKDLFEQKGIILYLIHTIAYKLSPTSFFGVYILEVISYSATLILFFKIGEFYFSKKSALFITCLTPLVLLNKDYFRFGDSAEEFSFPFILGLLYIIISIANNDRNINNKQYLIQGLLMGFVFWIKYTLIGPWIAFFIFTSIYYLIKKKWKKLIEAIIYSMIGFFIITFPIIIYFAMNHALTDMFFVYFKFNMSLYPKTANQFTNDTIIIRFINTIKIFIKLLSPNKLLSSILLIGSVYLMLSKKIFIKLKYRILWLLIFLCGNFFIFFGGISIKYYILLDLVILLLSFLSFFVLIKNCMLLFNFDNSLIKKEFSIIGIISSIVLMIFSNNTFKDMIFFPTSKNIQIPHKENTNPHAKAPAQIEFSKYFNNKKNITLLNYKFIDYGFSLKADIIPNVKYFMKVNIPYTVYPENIDEQNKYIKEKKIDYVIAGMKPNDNVNQFGTSWLHINYKVKAIHVQEREGKPIKYVLYQKNVQNLN